MGDLKRYRHGARNGVMTPAPDGSFVRYEAAAAALEAAREDGERLAWLEREAGVGIRLHNGDFNGRHVGLGLMLGSTRRTLRQAIDQARGKAGQEVGNGGRVRRVTTASLPE